MIAFVHEDSGNFYNIVIGEKLFKGVEKLSIHNHLFYVFSFFQEGD